ncbi:MAG TPA: transcription antitermination factor NusB [Ignavibacteria bacterium]|nr:transcription antitermination factor NusB [Ignavibacteria bacterium]
MASKRRFVRIKALEVLYAYQIAKDHIDKVKKDLLAEITDLEKYNFASELIDAVLKNQRVIDSLITERIKNWEYDRVAILDKIILRLAIAEILYFPEIPPKVSINEAIELAKLYCSDKSPTFVNGVLDAVLNNLKKENKLNKKGRGLLDYKKKADEE